MTKKELTLSMEEYQYMPLRDVVFHTLREAIMRGALKPGERLMEIKLANLLGVSRTPVREAIRMLEQEGLVIMMPRKGAQVAQITEKDLNDVLEVRMGLEELAVEFACQRITREQIEKLEKAAAEFRDQVNAAEHQDITDLADADERFHELIYQATDNQRLVQLLNNLREQMYRYRIEYLKDSQVWESLVEEHDAILQALKAGDSEMAYHYTEAHIRRQQDTIHQMMQENARSE